MPKEKVEKFDFIIHACISKAKYSYILVHRCMIYVYCGRSLKEKMISETKNIWAPTIMPQGHRLVNNDVWKLGLNNIVFFLNDWLEYLILIFFLMFFLFISVIVFRCSFAPQIYIFKLCCY